MSTDDAHIIIKSLINSSEQLHMNIDLLIQRKVGFRNDAYEVTDVAAFWTCFEVKEKFLDLFVEVDPVWDGENVLVNPSLANDPKMYAKVSVVIAYGYRWYNWSNTRWCKCGKCARFKTRSQFCGIDAAVDILFDVGRERYHINGYRLLNQEIMVFLTF